MPTEFNYLLSPLKIGPVEVPNRVMTSAHATKFADPNPEFGEPGFFGEKYARYVAERAKGGAGLITFGQVAVHPSTAYELLNLGIAWDERAIPGMKLAADLIHEHGSKVFIQLFHSGVNNNTMTSKLPVWGPSAVGGAPVNFAKGEVPHAMEEEDIAEIKEYYARSARNAKLAGMDGVELHATHSYLLQQFLSPLYNLRTDKYGGSLENRMRLMLELIEVVRNEIGSSMALGLRIPGDEMMSGGLTQEDMKEVARRLDATGEVDFLNVSLGSLHNYEMIIPSMYFPHGVWVYLAAGIKEVVQKAKVFAFGRIIDPVHAEQILADGQADMVVMNRALIADPELVNKAREGRLEEIRNCAGDCQECRGRGSAGYALGCVTNPAAGHEKDWGIGTMKRSPERKRVMVIGGGPGGMEVAQVAAARGHDVTLYEKSDNLGGQNNLAQMLPGRGEMESFTRWRRTMIKKHGVKVRLGIEVSLAMVEDEKPDVVVVATGSRPRKDGFNTYTYASIEGWEQDNVVSGDDVVAGQVSVGQNVVVYDSEAAVRALGVAEILAEQGKSVNLVTPGINIGGKVEPGILNTILTRLVQWDNIQIIPQTLITSFKDQTIEGINVLKRKAVAFENIDTLVVCTPNVANDSLYYELKGKVKELYLIGDAMAPRSIDRAIFDGHKVGRSI